MPPNLKRGRVQVDASPTKTPVAKRTRKDSDASLPPKKQSTPETDDSDASQYLDGCYDGFSDEEDQSSEDVDELEGSEDLEPDLRNRLRYIQYYTKESTPTFLRMIFFRLDNYMGPRNGSNDFIAASIVQHCYIQAMNGRSNLVMEKRAVGNAYVECFGGCGMDMDKEDDEDEDDPDVYDVPKEVEERLTECLRMLEELPVNSLKKIANQFRFPTFINTTSDGVEEEEEEITSDDFFDYLDVLAGKRGDLVKEEEIIREEWRKV